MSLYNNGTDRMRNALASWKDAVNHLEAGIDFLEHETDNQGDDLIRIDPDDGIMRSDLDTLKHYIPKVRNALNSSEIFVFNFDDVEREITISLASSYNTPIQDYKALLPVYSVELETISIESESFYVDSTATVTVSFEQEGYYSWYRSVSYEDGEEYYRSEDIDFYSAEIEQIWSALFERLSEKDDFYLSINLGGYFNSGAQDAICNINYSYEDPTKFMYVPKIIWEANSFNEWIFPDPTFGGLMPNMTDARFKEIFNIDGEGWEKTVSFGN
ncbi:MAG: hypothetical protein HQ568_02465 [Calditrichaeota bacterium]|nr:hypothetical protein [Calditrichota bacterium]